MDENSVKNAFDLALKMFSRGFYEDRSIVVIDYMCEYGGNDEI